MASRQKMILGILPSLGGSIESQKKDGREGLFLNYYIPAYLTKFDKVYYFSYANEKESMGSKQVFLFPNVFFMHRYLYAFLIPFFYFNQIRKCRLIRVMHLNGVIPAMIAKMLFGVPYVTTYGYNYVRFAEIEGHPLKAQLFKCLIPFFLKQANGIIVTTPELEREVSHYIGSTEKVRLIPNGVDISKFSPREMNTEKKKVFHLLFVGRLEKQKNLLFLLDVIQRLKDQRNILLTMIGNGSLEKELKDRVQRENLPVQFLGSVSYEEIANYYRQADCFISTSLAEGHPKALIEAMSSGLVCIVSHCAGNDSLIRHNDSGLLLKTDSVEVWVKEIMELINDPVRQEAFSKSARQCIADRFNIHASLQNEISLLTA